MPIDRNAITLALFNRLTSVLGAQVKTSDRRALNWSDIPSSQQPAMLVLGRSGTMSYEPGLPARNTVGAWIVFYARPQLAEDTPESTLMNLLQSVETALMRQPNEIVLPDDDGTTLGGLVYQCRIVDYALHMKFGQGQAALDIRVDMLAA